MILAGAVSEIRASMHLMQGHGACPRRAICGRGIWANLCGMYLLLFVRG